VSAKSQARAVRVRERAVNHTVVKCSTEIQRSCAIRAPGPTPSSRPLIPSRSCPLPKAPALRAPPCRTARPLSSPDQGPRPGWAPPFPAPSTHSRRLWLSRSASSTPHHASRPPAAPFVGDVYRLGGASPAGPHRPRGAVPGGSPRVGRGATPPMATPTGVDSAGAAGRGGARSGCSPPCPQQERPAQAEPAPTGAGLALLLLRLSSAGGFQNSRIAPCRCRLPVVGLVLADDVETWKLCCPHMAVALVNAGKGRAWLGRWGNKPVPRARGGNYSYPPPLSPAVLL